MNIRQNSSSIDNCLGVFAKYWQSGQVKTRLATGIGDQHASQIYLAFLRTILARFSHVADQRILAYWPTDRRQEFADLAGKCWKLTPQIVKQNHSNHGLGQRMKDFFDLRFQEGAARVVLIGSDSPTLPVAFVEQAFAALLQQRAVIGQADDGGYYLIGMSKFEPRIFEDVAWSTDQVFCQTIAIFQQLDLSYSVLPTWNDVDDREDLLRLRKQLQDSQSSDRHCDRLLSELDSLFNELIL